MELRDKKVVVVGMGRTALAVTRLLLREGARPFVTEAKSADRFAAPCAELDALGVPYECGGHSEGAFDGVTLVVLSPGVPPGLPVFDALRNRTNAAPVMSEMEFTFPFCRSRILAVTGTNGKTTTTELLRSLIAACGHSVLLAGNNDEPFSAAVLADPAPEFLVLEVSSYQLETAVRFHPWIGVVLNVTPDHLARHHTMEEYAAVKARIYAAQCPGDVAVINLDDPYVAAMPVPDGGTRFEFSLSRAPERGLWLDGDVVRDGQIEVARRADIPLLGRHNIENVLAALTMMRAGGFDAAKTLDGLRAFRGVEHRIEWTASLDGVDFYNDSKATNVESLRAALESFDRPVVLIAGGEGKGSDYRVLRDLVQRHVKRLVTLGQDAPLLEAAFGDLAPTERASDMTDAVARAASAAAAGDAVLLSPACASFDMYDNFEQRGRVFKEAVRRYVASAASGEGQAS